MSKDIREKLEKELKSAPKKFVVQIESSAENYNDVLQTSLDFLLEEKNSRGIYVTLNKPVTVLAKELEGKKIDSKRLFFIDGITGTTAKKEEPENFVILSGPTALTELSIEITKAKETGKFDFLLFDTISTLLIYNSQKRSLQFAYFLLTKLKDFALSGIIIYLKSDLEKEVFESVAHLGDKTLRF